ncbi:hypothetical protein EDB86DRAFT_3180726 [Lactarius hatsudake]|nr:hypothetical protein EDB86DRAFT_3183396 [Lactarius hatsudake]KAH8991844.1 hypothetical protein EDB86DRAFT_3180726 [Lactarius hatsudake]
MPRLSDPHYPEFIEFSTSYYGPGSNLTVYDDLLVGIVYGIYIVLYVTSARVLLSPPGFISSRPRMLWFGITTFMFVLGTTALALQKALELQNIDFIVFYFADGFITRLMYILSDIICAWRAVVIWDRDKRVIAILLLFILGTITAAGCEMGLGVVPRIGQFTVESTSSQSGPLYMIGPSLGTNLLSTGLIAWKAWRRRFLVKKHMVTGAGSVSLERFLALLIESGFLYCIPWILYLISAFGVIPDPGFTVIDDVMVFISGIYPTLIIILVAMQKSPVEHYSTHSTGMQFVSGPAPRPPRAGDMPRHMYAQVRNSDMQSHPSMAVANTSEDEPVAFGRRDENTRYQPVETRESLAKERYFLSESGGERESGGPAVERTLLKSLPVFDTCVPVHALVGVSPSFYFELRSPP